jgi:hypothetical protein
VTDNFSIKELKQKRLEAFENEEYQEAEDISDVIIDKYEDLINEIKRLSNQDCRTCCAILELIDKAIEEV